MPRNRTSGRKRRISRRAKGELQLKVHLYRHRGRFFNKCPFCQIDGRAYNFPAELLNGRR